MKSNRNWFGLLCAIALILATQIRAAEITGTVRSVSGGTAIVALQGENVPSVGDKAEVFFKLAGAEEDVSVATGSVLRVEADSVEVKIENATGEVAKDLLVRITSPNPQKRVATVTSTPTSSPTTQPPASDAGVSGKDPSFAFVDMNKIFKEFPRTKQAEAQINEAKNAAKTEYDLRVAKYVKLLDEIKALTSKAESPKVAAADKVEFAAQRDAKVAEATAMHSEIKSFQAEREKELGDDAQRKRDGILGEIRATIKEVSGGLPSFVVDVSGAGTSGIQIFLITPTAGQISDQIGAALKGQKASAIQPASDLKVGLIDLNDVFKRFGKTKKAETEIMAAKEAAKKEYDRRAASYQSLINQINDLNKKMESAGGTAGARVAKDREAKIAKVKAMEQEINQWRTTKEKDLQAQASAKRQAIISEIEQVVADKLSSLGNVLLLDSTGNSSNNTPLVLFSREIPDLTDEITAALNGSASRTSAVGIPLPSSSTLRFAAVDLTRAGKAMPEADAVNADIREKNEKAKAELATADATTKQAKEKEMKDYASRKLEPLVDRLVNQARQLARTGGYNLVLDTSGFSLNGLPIVLEHQNVPELTDAVSAALKAGPQ